MQVGAGRHQSIDHYGRVSVHPDRMQRRLFPVIPRRGVGAGFQERGHYRRVRVHAGCPVQRCRLRGVRGVGLATGRQQRRDDGFVFVPCCPVHGSRSDAGVGAQLHLVLEQRSEHCGHPVEHRQVHGSSAGLHRRVGVGARLRQQGGNRGVGVQGGPVQRRGTVAGQCIGVGSGLQQCGDDRRIGGGPGGLVQRRIGQAAARLRVCARGQTLPHLRQGGRLEERL